MIADLITSLLSKQISIDGLVFDAYLELVQTDTVTVTNHPVQRGANVSDHAYRNPIEFDYLIGVTNTSIGKSWELMGISLPLIGKNRAVYAYSKLVEMMEQRKLVTLKNRYNMDPGYQVILTSVTTDDDYRTADCLKVRVHMKEVILTKAIVTMSAMDLQIVQSNPMGSLSPKPLSSNLFIRGHL